jgi:hypothetical protein
MLRIRIRKNQTDFAGSTKIRNQAWDRIKTLFLNIIKSITDQTHNRKENIFLLLQQISVIQFQGYIWKQRKAVLKQLHMYSITESISDAEIGRKKSFWSATISIVFFWIVVAENITLLTTKVDVFASEQASSDRSLAGVFLQCLHWGFFVLQRILGPADTIIIH